MIQKLIERMKMYTKGYTANYYFPSILIENTTACPVHCIHCPDKIWHGKIMPDTVWQKIMSDFKRYNVNYTNIIFGMTGEPLLDKNLVNKILQLDSLFPGRGIMINTSGKCPTKDLLDNVGIYIARVSFTFCGYDKKSYEENTRNSSFEIAYKNVQDTINFPGRNFPVYISYLAIKQNIGHKKDIEKLFPGIELIIASTSNRCGFLKNFEELLPDNRIDNGRCPKISDDLSIAFDGKILSCCWDWGHELPVGDLNVHSLRYILEGKKRKKIDKMLREGRHEEIVTCSKCRAGSNEHIKMI